MLKAELNWARQQALKALRDDARAQSEDWRAVLLPAARLVLGAADRLAAESELFADLTAATEYFASKPELRYDAISLLSQNLTALLNYLGYRPPPKTGEIESDLTESLAHLFQSNDLDLRHSLGLSDRLWNNLYFFRRRLQELIHDAEASSPGRIHNGVPLRLQLRSALVKGTKIALPAAIAAGATALVFPPAGAAVAGIAAGVSAGGGAAGHELLKRATEAATAGMLDKALHGEGELTNTVDRWQRAAATAARRVEQLASLLDEPATMPDRTRSQALVIDASSHVYDTMRLSFAVGDDGTSWRHHNQFVLDLLPEAAAWANGAPLDPMSLASRLRAAAERIRDASVGTH